LTRFECHDQFVNEVWREVVALSQSDLPGRLGVQGASPVVQEVIARAQRLSESPRPVGGYSLQWYVEASLIGDMTAITAAALRSEAPLQR
jgi:hypothetical protein